MHLARVPTFNISLIAMWGGGPVFISEYLERCAQQRKQDAEGPRQRFKALELSNLERRELYVAAVPEEGIYNAWEDEVSLLIVWHGERGRKE